MVNLYKDTKPKLVLYHRLIYQIHNKDINLKGLEIDHINRDKADNRIENLQLATRSENNQNKIFNNVSSKYRGVSWDKARNKWHTKGWENNKPVYVGRYENELEAAIAYDKYIFKNGLDNEFRQLNCRLYPDEISEEELQKEILN
jgi:hypothetical protein